MSERATQRAEVLRRLSAALRQDPRLAGAVLVGSGAHGFQDDESDIDLVAPVATEYDAATVFREWKECISDLIAVRYHAETAFTEQHHLLVLLCADRLEVDLSFPPVVRLAALSPNWQVLWDRSGEVARRMVVSNVGSGIAGKQAYVWTLNRAVHRAVYASKALRRGHVWQALLLLDELRCRAVQLACLNALGEAYSDVLGQNGVERHVDHLPPEVLAELSRSLPPHAGVDALHQSLAACVDAVLRHAATLDRRYGVERSEPLAVVLSEHLDLSMLKVQTDAV